MSDGGALAYTCDGTLEGVLCCVFESYTRKEIPLDILPDGQPTFYRTRRIETNEASAARVRRSIERMGGEVYEWMELLSLSCISGYEMVLYRFIRKAFAHGISVTHMLADSDVNTAFKAVRAVRNEAHLLVELLRFSEHSGVLVAEIEPDAMVLPLLKEHFTDRFPEEMFVILDVTHDMALFYRPYQSVIRPAQIQELPACDETEQLFQTLWTRYYDTIGIEGRYNPKCRMTHMPRHFWKHMTEMKNLRVLKGRDMRDNQFRVSDDADHSMLTDGT